MPVIFSNAHVASCYAVRRMAKRVLNLVRMPASKSIVRLKVESKTRQAEQHGGNGAHRRVRTSFLLRLCIRIKASRLTGE